MKKQLLYTSITTAALFVGTQLGVNNAQADATTDNGTGNQATTTSATQGSAKTVTNEQLATVKPTSQQQYQTNVHTAKGNVAAAKNQVNAAQTKVATAQGQVSNQSQLIAAGQNQYDAGKAKVDNAQQQLEAKNQVVAKAESQVNADQAKIAAAEQQIPADQQQIATNNVAITNQPAIEKNAQAAKNTADATLAQAKTDQATAQSAAKVASTVTATKQADVDQATTTQQKAVTQVNKAQAAVTTAQGAVNKNTQAISSAKTAIQGTSKQINANKQAVAGAQTKLAAAQAALTVAKQPTTTTETQSKYSAAEFPQSELTGSQTVTVAYPANGNYVPNVDKINQYMFDYINELRALNGQPALKQTAALQNNAIARAAAQTDGGLDHTGSIYAENLTQLFPDWFLSDQEVAYEAIMGWYDESNNVESGSFGHRINLIYSEGNAGVAANLAKHVAAFEVDNSGMSEAEFNKYYNLFYTAHTDAATKTKALPAITFKYVQTTPADPKKIAAANATLNAAMASLNDLQDTGKSLATKLANQNASLQTLQSQTSGLQAAVTTKQAQVKVAAASLVTANANLVQAKAQLTTAQRQQSVADQSLKATMVKTATAQATANQAAKNLASAKTLVADLTAENSRLAAEIEALPAQIAAMKAQKAMREQQITTAKAMLAQAQAQVDQANEQLAVEKAQLDSKKTDLAQLKQVLGAAQVDLAVAQGDLTATEAFLARVEANKFTTTTTIADQISEKATADKPASATITALHGTTAKATVNVSDTANMTNISVDASAGNGSNAIVKAKQQSTGAQAAVLPKTGEEQPSRMLAVGLLAASLALFGLVKPRKRV
ncbi:cell surface protein [Lactiplantibacillus plantarum]|nr:cell surface protein [Lactiplantibacillus plantarum]